MQHQEETRHKWLQFWPPHFNTVATLPCETQVIEHAVGESRYSVNHFWADVWAIQYEFIVVNGQTMISAFHKVV